MTLVRYVAPGLLIVLGIICYRLHGKFFSCLRTRHSQLLLGLGTPNANIHSRAKYLFWFWSRGYDQANDPELAALGSKITGATLLAIVLFVIWAATS